MDGRQWIDIYVRTSVDGRLWMEGAERMEQGQTSDGMTMDVGWKGNGTTEHNGTNCDCANNGVVERSASASSKAMVYIREKINFFLLLRVFNYYSLLILLPELL
jgi:hypothetical protein